MLILAPVACSVAGTGQHWVSELRCYNTHYNRIIHILTLPYDSQHRMIIGTGGPLWLSQSVSHVVC